MVFSGVYAHLGRDPAFSSYCVSVLAVVEDIRLIGAAAYLELANSQRGLDLLIMP